VRLDRACRSEPELALTLAVLGGELVLRSQRGTRSLAASEFLEDMLTTARAPDELIVAVRFPVMAGQGVSFREVARRHGDFAIVAVAAAIETDGTVRLGVGGMAGSRWCAGSRATLRPPSRMGRRARRF